MNGLTGKVAELYNALEPDLKVTARHGKNFTLNSSTQSRLNAIEGLNCISLTLSDKALLKSGEKQALVTIKGVDANFQRITKLDSVLMEGFNGVGDSTKYFLVVGRGIGDQLGISDASYSRDVQMFSPKKGKSTSLNPEDDLVQLSGSVSGQFALNDELDYQVAFVNLQTARELFESEGKVSAIEIMCSDGKAKHVQHEVAEILGEGFEVKNRYQLNDVLFKSLETEKLATFIILAFILIIATFNLIGALTMLIIEKRKDIKTLFSLGADIKTIQGIFMREGLFISGIGAALGLLIGLLVCWLQIKFHLVTFGSEFIIPYYPIEIQAGDLLKIFLLIMGIAFLAALYPVRVFTKTDLVHSRTS
ncbi:MAG: FtsX-like permease family protein [Bacteroidia bacterium]|jgi:lipoprotein-releasing system permease protein|nr:FtsX-like permease family protein [Bacteroidia bacterium]